MFSNIIILSLSLFSVIIYGYCARKWLRLWWPVKVYSAHAMFLGNVLMLIFSVLTLAQSTYSVFTASDRYSPFTLALITVIFIHALIQLALALGYFNEKE